jgi:hypothetical protein
MDRAFAGASVVIERTAITLQSASVALQGKFFSKAGESGNRAAAIRFLEPTIAIFT